MTGGKVLFQRYFLASASRSTFTQLVFPYFDSLAKMRAVFPSLSFALTSAPAASNAFTHSALPPRQTANIRAVFPSLFFAFIFAPAISNSFTHSVLPHIAAFINAVSPSSSFTLMSVPADTNAFTHSVCPFPAATMRAVLPSSPFASTRAPSLINSVTQSIFPSLTAFMRTVFPFESLLLASGLSDFPHEERSKVGINARTATRPIRYIFVFICLCVRICSFWLPLHRGWCGFIVLSMISNRVCQPPYALNESKDEFGNP